MFHTARALYLWPLVLLCAVAGGCQTKISTIPARTKFASSAGRPIPMLSINRCPAVLTSDGVFLIDTGTSLVCLSEHAARSHGLHIFNNATMHLTDAAGHEELLTHVARVRMLDFGPARFEDFAAVVLTPKDRMKVPFEGGLLGLTLFWNCQITFDFASSTFQVDRPQPAPPGAIGIDTRRGLPEMPIMIGDQLVHAVVDTGDSGSITISRELAETLPFEEGPEQGEMKHSASGWYPSYTGRLAMDIRIGEFVFPRPVVTIGEGRTAIGTAALAPFVMTISPSGGWMTLEEAPASEESDDAPPPIIPVAASRNDE